MAHEIDFSTGRAGIAIRYDGETPWHGYGNRVSDDADLDTWRVEAGLNWDVARRRVLYGVMREDGTKAVAQYAGRQVLLRTDTQEPLSIVSDGYHVVQPGEVMEFYRDLIEANGFKMDTAGSLMGGRRIWALAKLGKETRIFGQDRVNGYLLLATSYDGTMATTARFVATRVVCNNTLQIGLQEAGEGFKLNHDREFDADEAKAALGLNEEAWKRFEDESCRMACTYVDLETSLAFFTKVLGKDAVVLDETSGKMVYAPTFEKMFAAYQRGPGATLRSAQNTAWGLVNAVTFYQDHMARGNASGSRLNSAWFGAGAARKNRAYEEALKLAA